MSTISVVQRRQQAIINPYTQLHFPRKSRVTKGFHLSSPRRPNDIKEDLRPIKGETLLAVPTKCLNTPRIIQAHSQHEQVAFQSNVGRSTIDGLNIVGERKESLDCSELHFPGSGSLFTLHTDATVIPYPGILGKSVQSTVDNSVLNQEEYEADFLHSPTPRCAFEVSTLDDHVSTEESLKANHFINQDGTNKHREDVITKSSTISFNTTSPDAPPTTPFTSLPGTLDNFHLDGHRLRCNSNLRINSARDFIPGYVKRTRYCCSKCEVRMTGHESLQIETSSPFYAYQHSSSTNVAPCTPSESTTELYNFLSYQQTLPASLRYSRICQRYKPWYGLHSQSQPMTPVSNASDEFNETNNVVDQSNVAQSLHIKEEYGSNSAKLLTSYTLDDLENKTNSSVKPRVGNTTADEYKKKSSSDEASGFVTVSNERALADDTSSITSNDESEDSESPTLIFPRHREWQEVWNQRNIFPSRMFTDENNVHTEHENSRANNMDELLCNLNFRGCRLSQNPDSSDGKNSPIRGLISHEEPPGEQLHDILLNCADSLRNVFKNVAPVSTASLEDQTDKILPDVARCTDICFQAMTDKRYNRWRRKKRKSRHSKSEDVASRNGSPFEEVKKGNNQHGFERIEGKDKLSPLIRRKSPDADDVYSVRDDLNVENERLVKEKSLMIHQTNSSLGLPSEKFPDDLQCELTSFPALNNFHYPSRRDYLSEPFTLYNSTVNSSSTFRSSKLKGSRSDGSPRQTSAERNRLSISPPIVSKDSEDDDEPITSSSNQHLSWLIPQTSYSPNNIQYPNSYYDSVAKKTIVRVNYSIQEKISKASTPEIKIFKSLPTKPQKNKSIVGDGTPIKSSLQKKTLSAKINVKELNETQTDSEKLTLGHLLQSMSGKNRGRLLTPKSIRPERQQNSEIDEVELKPKVGKAKISMKKINMEEKERSIDRRMCVGDKMPALDQGRQTGQRSHSTPEVKAVQFKDRPVSQIDLSRAFTYSYFQLPHDYKLNNSIIQRRRLSQN